MGMYEGVNASEGIGIGTVAVAVDPDLSFEAHTVDDTAAEQQRYESALGVFCTKTEAQVEHMKASVGEAESEIMAGHITMAKDPFMLDEIAKRISGGMCAEQALSEVCDMFSMMFAMSDEELIRQRVTDIEDIRTGILAELLGKEVIDLSVLPAGTVIVVHEIGRAHV